MANARMLVFPLCLLALLAGLTSSSWAQKDNISDPSSDWFELAQGWRLMSADQINGEDAAVSLPNFDASHWYEVQHMPATVLEILQEDGIYKNLYYGTSLVTPGDLWKKDWWYRTTFTAPEGREVHSLIFKGINYRADIWLNGQRIADKSQVVGMYNSFEFDVSKVIQVGKTNVLAVKITPEQMIPKVVSADPLRIEGPVELGDTWHDWLNWKYIGVRDAKTGMGFSFPPDRNAGVWKRVYLSSTGAVSIRNPYVATDLPLPATTPASLTVYCDLTNHTAQPVSGILTGEITRQGKPPVHFEQPVSLYREEVKEVSFTPAAFPDLLVPEPGFVVAVSLGRGESLSPEVAVQGKRRGFGRAGD